MEQSGFRRNRQTKDNIAFLTQKIKENFDLKKNVQSLFFDISSAFDKVWHQGLLIKLIAIKTPYYLVKIIEQFLKDRTFVVKIGNMKSEKKKALVGVPQGGVLSTTLFSIFINDITIRKKQKIFFAVCRPHLFSKTPKTSLKE